MIHLLCLFSLINFGASTKRNAWRSQKKRILDDDFTTACDLCNNLYNLLIRYENFGYTDDQIQASLLSSCNVFTGKAQTVCNYICDTYFPVFLYLAKEGITAQSSCVKMGYCSDLD